MKIVTWNINSIRLRINLLEKLILEQKPDVICLQETKTIDDFFPLDIIKTFGYKYTIFSGEKSYNGVSIISNRPIEKSFSLNLYNNDKRHIAALIEGTEIHNFYIPSGGDEPDPVINPKFRHKLAFIELIKQWFFTNRKKEQPIILAGDLNIAPHEHDVWSSKSLRNVVSHTEIEKKLLLDLQYSFDFVDSARHFINMEEKIYSWWSYRSPNWQESNKGRRLDHIWVTKPLINRMVNILALKDARAWNQPSDHVPYILELSAK